MKYKIGDKLIIKDSITEITEHSFGLSHIKPYMKCIIKVIRYEEIGIEFDVNIEGCSLSGECELGYGMWFSNDEVDTYFKKIDINWREQLCSNLK